MAEVTQGLLGVVLLHIRCQEGAGRDKIQQYPYFLCKIRQDKDSREGVKPCINIQPPPILPCKRGLYKPAEINIGFKLEHYLYSNLVIRTTLSLSMFFVFRLFWGVYLKFTY